MICRRDRPKTKPGRRQAFELRGFNQRRRSGTDPYWNAFPEIVSLGHFSTPNDSTLLFYNLGLLSER